MKNPTFFLNLLLMLAGSAVYAQPQKGNKIIKTDIGFGLTIGESMSILNNTVSNDYAGNNYNMSVEPVYGRVKKNNILVYYGFIFQYNHSKSTDNITHDIYTSNQTNIGPVFGMQKFFPLAPKIFYCPQYKIGAFFGYSREKNTTNQTGDDFIGKTFSASLNITPFNLGFVIKKKLMGTFYLGSFNVYYSNQSAKRVITPGEEKGTSFGIYGSTGAYSFGLLFIL